MKQIQKYTAIASLAIALATPAFAANNRGGGRGGAVARAGGSRPQISHVAATARHFAGNTGFRAASFRTTRVATRSPAFSHAATARTFAPSAASSRFTQARVNNAALASRTNVNASRNATAFNRGNNYGGRWVAAGAHTDWNRAGDHYWNHHHYRWFDGGWLIVDNGFWPYGYPYYGYDYNQPTNVSDSIAADVQSDLAQQGYYNGPIDGDIGPMSRQAIANYQQDHGLPVSGAIDQPLLGSMGLE